MHSCNSIFTLTSLLKRIFIIVTSICTTQLLHAGKKQITHNAPNSFFNSFDLAKTHESQAYTITQAILDTEFTFQHLIPTDYTLNKIVYSCHDILTSLKEASKNNSIKSSNEKNRLLSLYKTNTETAHYWDRNVALCMVKNYCTFLSDNELPLSSSHLELLHTFATRYEIEDEPYMHTLAQKLAQRACEQYQTREVILRHPHISYGCQIILAPTLEYATRDEKYLSLYKDVVNRLKPYKSELVRQSVNRFFSIFSDNSIPLCPFKLAYFHELSKTYNTQLDQHGPACKSILSRLHHKAATMPSMSSLLIPPVVTQLLEIMEQDNQRNRLSSHASLDSFASDDYARLYPYALRVLNDALPLQALSFAGRYCKMLAHKNTPITPSRLDTLCEVVKQFGHALQPPASIHAADALLSCAHDCKNSTRDRHLRKKLLSVFPTLFERSTSLPKPTHEKLTKTFLAHYYSNKDSFTVASLRTFFELNKKYGKTCPAYTDTMESWTSWYRPYQAVTSVVLSDHSLAKLTEHTPFCPTAICANLTKNILCHDHLVSTAESTVMREEPFKSLYSNTLIQYVQANPANACMISDLLACTNHEIAELSESLMLTALASDIPYGDRLDIASRLAKHNRETYLPIFEEILYRPYEQANDIPAKIDALAHALRADVDFRQELLQGVIARLMQLFDMQENVIDNQVVAQSYFDDKQDCIIRILENSMLNPAATDQQGMWHLASTLFKGAFGTLTLHNKLRILRALINNPALSQKQAYWAYAMYMNLTGIWCMMVADDSPCKPAIDLLNIIINQHTSADKRRNALTQLIAKEFPCTLIKRIITTSNTMSDTEESALLEELDKHRHSSYMKLMAH